MFEFGHDLIQANAALVLDTAEAGVNPFVWGQPGGGKTTSILSEAARRGYTVCDMTGSTREPSDFSGIPFRDHESFKLLPPVWVKDLNGADRALLLLDELTRSSTQVQSAMLKLISERVVGDTRLADHVRIVAISNPPTAGDSAGLLTAAMSNRFGHFFWSVNPKDWISGLLGEWYGTTESSERVASYISLNPGALAPDLPENPVLRGLTWPSPRTWHKGIQLADNTDMSLVTALQITVGAGAANQFNTWASASNLPSIDDVLESPEDIDWEELGSDAVYMLGLGLASRTRFGDRDDRLSDALRAMVKGGHADALVPAVLSLLDYDIVLPLDLLESFTELIEASRQARHG